jgi:rhodanese-related sulfurtransferase
MLAQVIAWLDVLARSAAPCPRPQELHVSSFQSAPAVPVVSVDDAAQPPAGVALVDVRTLAEWTAGHVGSATHVPLDRFEAEALPEASTLYVICRSGNRSARAVEALIQAGYDAHNVTGGMNAWVAAGYDVVRDDGSPGQVV